MNSNHLHSDIAHLEISIRSWLPFLPLQSTSNFQALFPDYFWWPNAPTPNPNKLEVLPHCTDCIEQLASLKPTLLRSRSRSANFYTFTNFGKEILCTALLITLDLSYLSDCWFGFPHLIFISTPVSLSGPNFIILLALALLRLQDIPPIQLLRHPQWLHHRQTPRSLCTN